MCEVWGVNQLSAQPSGKLATVKKLRAEASSVSPSWSESRTLWVALGYMENGGATLLVGTWQRRKQEKIS